MSERPKDFEEICAEYERLIESWQQATNEARARSDLLAADVARLAGECERYRSAMMDARAHLAEATAHNAVLQAALNRADMILNQHAVIYRKHWTECAHITEVVANPNPLAAAVGRVVAAAGKWRDTDEDMETIESLEEAVDALRAITPWYPS